jgi:hypothetical protein
MVVTGLVIRRAEQVLLVIPLLFLARVTVGEIFPQVRAAAKQNRLMDWLWFAMAFIALILQVIPRIA